ncbi:MAG TPA: response regulator [Opitutaceae bacterium]|nr:response regulator [Opitutaceae bacterium]
MTAGGTPPEILIIDDEVQIRRLLRITLEAAGYRVREAETGGLGLNEAAVRRPDAVILDLSLPDLNGLEVLRRLREWSRLPVLILSVRGEENEKVAALDAGADDYLTKPFGGNELLARLRVLLRRTQPVGEASIVRFGQVEVDFNRRTVLRAGVDAHLTTKEYALLRLLLQHRGKVVTHRQILREIWGPRHEEDTHYLRVHMANLRKKLELSAGQPAFLKTESGIGYRFADAG